MNRVSSKAVADIVGMLAVVMSLILVGLLTRVVVLEAVTPETY